MRTSRVVALVAAIALSIITMVSGVAGAACGEVCTAGQHLNAANPLYISPAVDGIISNADGDRLVSAMQSSPVPIYIAILSERAAGTVGGVDNLPHAVAVAQGGDGVRGVFAVVSGSHIRAGASSQVGFNKGDVQQLANAAVSSRNPRDYGLAAMLGNFVNRVVNHTPVSDSGNNSASDTSKSSDSSGSGNAMIVFYVIIGVLLFAGIVIGISWGVSSRNRRRREAEAAQKRFADRKAGLMARRNTLADQVLDLDARVQVNPQAEQCYRSSVNAFTKAKQALESATAMSELDAIENDIRRAEMGFDDAEAYLDGRDPVEERRAAEEAAERVRTERAAAEAVERARIEARRAEVRSSGIREGEYEPSASRTSEATHYYGGGRYQGVYYAPGYYRDPFWDWVMMDAVLHSHDDRDEGYSHHDSGSHHKHHAHHSSSDGDFGGFGGGGDWGGGGSFGGSGDWGGGGGGGGGDFGGGGGGGGGDW